MLTDLLQLTCLQTCNNLCVFTRVADSFFSAYIAHVLLTYKIFEMKITPETGISLRRLTFSHRPFTKSGIRILPANSVISEVMIACTELKTQKLSEHAMVKGHTCLHKLARQSMFPPPGTSIFAIALPAGTSYEPKARGWPGGVGTAGID